MENELVPDDLLQTRRLILRPIVESDAEEAHMWFSDSAVMEFFDYGPHARVEETLDRIKRYRRHYNRYGFGKCIILEKGANRPIGDAGLAVVEHTGETQVGYKLARAYWGHGFATEAAAALVQFGFARLELPRIVALIHPDNTLSTRVAEKVGFRYCRTDFRNNMEQLVYELLRKEA
jgi:RimJ/RimL family protein N-acetyltransferase